MTIYSLDVLLFLFGTSLLFHVQFYTVASWPAYRFLKRQVRWSGIPISFRIFHSLLWSTQRVSSTWVHPVGQSQALSWEWSVCSPTQPTGWARLPPSLWSGCKGLNEQEDTTMLQTRSWSALTLNPWTWRMSSPSSHWHHLRYQQNKCFSQVLQFIDYTRSQGGTACWETTSYNFDWSAKENHRHGASFGFLTLESRIKYLSIVTWLLFCVGVCVCVCLVP